MKIVCKEANITPLKPIIQGGYAAQRNRPYDKVHDDCLAKVFCITFKNKKMLFVCLDCTGLEETVIERIINLVNKQGCPITTSDVIFNVSHTHCGPATNTVRMGESLIVAPEEYVEYYTKQIADAMVQAYNEIGEEVTTKFSTFTIDGIYSNRNNISKPSNKNVYFIGFFDKDDKLKAIIYNMSHHCTVLGPNWYECSADLFGCLRSTMEKQFGCPVLIAQGSAGDMGNRQYRQGNDYKEVERETKALMDQINWRLDFQPIDMEEIVVENYSYLAKYHHDASVYQKKIEEFEKMLETETDFDMIKLINSGIGGFKRKMAVATADYEKEMPFSIFRMNELTLVTCPGELGSFLALRILKHNPTKHMMVWGYSNGMSEGYMIEKEAFDQFSQEANVTIWPAGICDEFVDCIISKL